MYDEVIFRPAVARWLGVYLAMAELCGSLERSVARCLLHWAEVVGDAFGRDAAQAYTLLKEDISEWKD